MKHYLAIFNQDYADEHTVPAIACFNQEEYDNWCATKITKLDPNYASKKVEFDTKMKAFTDYNNEYNQKIKDNGGKSNDEIIVWSKENYVKSIYSFHAPKQGKSLLRAWLGNSGECFEEGYEIYHTGKNMVDARVINVTEVSKDFYNTFKLVDLDQINLCNVFEIEDDSDEDDEYED